MRVADLLMDGEPYCIDCAVEIIENEGDVPLRVAYRVEEARSRPLPAPRYVATVENEAELRALQERAKLSPYYIAPPEAELVARPPAASAGLQVTRDEPHEPKPEPAGQLSLLADSL
jgi:hypothetical protein